MIIQNASNNTCAANTDKRLNVAVSIRPLHSIVASIMQGIGSPTLMVKHSQSPHHANLKPSQASILAKADMIFWIGPELETFLQKPVYSTANHAQTFRLSKIAGLQLSLLSQGQPDPHIWLSIENAIEIAKFTADKLIEANPSSAKTIRKNLAQFQLDMGILQFDLETILDSQKDHHFLVYHDALRYLEHKFQFHTQAINIGNEEITAGARQIIAIGKLMRSRLFQCLLVEPNINASAIVSLARDNEIPVAMLDPLGSELPTGPGLYDQLMRDLALTIANCAK
ncbi:MAG: zinc ABC transporter solute-binding protein [Hyphomicrobiales bacterium]|nr:zinc ABC transporter solute-binding protein [Hyphomicrobiales bacterium]